MGVSGLTTFLRDNRQSCATYVSRRTRIRPAAANGKDKRRSSSRRQDLNEAEPESDEDGDQELEEEQEGQGLDEEELEECNMVVDAWG